MENFPGGREPLFPDDDQVKRMAARRQYLVMYDISDSKRLRRMDRLISGYGYRIQYSIFLCSLSGTMKAQLTNEIRQIINSIEDQCCLIDLGKQDNPADLFIVLGRPLIKIPKITFL